MSDWIGLAFFVLVLAGAFFGLSHLGKPPKQISAEEFERRVQEGRGAMISGMASGMYALQKLMNPRTAKAVEVQKDLKAGHYNKKQKVGEDGDTDSLEAEANDSTDIEESNA